MEALERERVILDTLAEQGALSVADLSRELAVSEVTVRSDLRDLEKRGLLSRVHGGAVPCLHPHILERQSLMVEEKQAIARAAAALVGNGDTIMVEAGTTPALVCRYLGGKRDVHVITNSNLAFNAAKTNPALRITLCGGEFRGSTESFVGPITVETLGRFNVGLAFVGTDGFSARQGFTTHLLEGAEVIKVMRERARRTIVLTDATKYGRAGPVTIMPLGWAGGLITGAGLSDDGIEELGEAEGILRLEVERDEAVTRFWFGQR